MEHSQKWARQWALTLQEDLAGEIISLTWNQMVIKTYMFPQNTPQQIIQTQVQFI